MQKLTIDDLVCCGNLAKIRDGKLNEKQISILAKKANSDIGTDYFWEWYYKKYGLNSERGKGAGMSNYAYYYFEDLFK